MWRREGRGEGTGKGTGEQTGGRTGEGRAEGNTTRAKYIITLLCIKNMRKVLLTPWNINLT